MTDSSPNQGAGGSKSLNDIEKEYRDELEGLLRRVMESEAALKTAAGLVAVFRKQVWAMTDDDPRRTTSIINLVDAELDLAKQFVQLSVVKADVGIVGDFWYKTPDTPAPRPQTPLLPPPESS